jgi:hypothetical protein
MYKDVLAGPLIFDQVVLIAGESAHAVRAAIDEA